MSDYLLIVAFSVTPLAALLGIYVIHHQPRLFFFAYLLFSTRMFGFLPKVASVRVPSIMFFLHCAMILSVIVWILKGRMFPNRMLTIFLMSIFLLIAFGILYPSFLGFSTIRSSIVDGKAMFAYGVLGYLAINHQFFDLKYFVRITYIFAIILTFILVVGKLTGFCPPGYYFVYEFGLQQTIQINHVTYIMLATFIVASRMLKPRISLANVLLFLFLLVGLALQAHRAVLLSTLMGISILWLLRMHSTKKLILLFVAIPILVALSFPGINYYYKNLIVQPITELMRLEGAIAARRNINAFRIEHIKRRPLLGYGFIDETSALGKGIAEESASPYTQALGVVDSGYIDSTARFGIIGSTMLYGVFILLILGKIKNLNQIGNLELSMIIFIAAFFAINYTWSVFAYEFGIISASVAVYILYKENIMNTPTSRNRQRIRFFVKSIPQKRIAYS